MRRSPEWTFMIFVQRSQASSVEMILHRMDNKKLPRHR